jgi:hypothetical protein
MHSCQSPQLRLGPTSGTPQGVPTHAAIWLVPHSGKRWKVFLCDAHRGQVDGASLLTEDDRAELEHRHRQEQLALAGKPYLRPKPL